eukprot:1836168-Prymnesium_polylepis.1
MSKPNPDGEGVACSAEGCNVMDSSNWYGKKGSKLCRPCYGKKNQRIGAAGGASGCKRVALEPAVFEQPMLESPLDAAAPISQI